MPKNPKKSNFDPTPAPFRWVGRSPEPEAAQAQTLPYWVDLHSLDGDGFTLVIEYDDPEDLRVDFRG